MSGHLLRAVALTACLAAAVAPALSESIDRNSENPRLNTVKPKGLNALFGSGSGTEGPAANELKAQQTKSVVGERTMNITQPEAPDVVPQQPQQQQQLQEQPVQQPPFQFEQAQPAPPPVVEPEPAPRQAAPARPRESKTAEADWWNETGNPKVFAFRDCISGHARSEALARPKLNLKSVLADSMKGECKGQFAAVSSALADRFGSKRGRQMAEELSGSTFVPAVREAVLTVRKEQQVAARSNQPAQPAAQVATASQQAASPVPVPSPEPQAQPAGAAAVATTATAPQPVGPALDVAIAKEELFTCYRAQTDALGPQPGKDVDMVVDQVLLECSDHTRAFFTRLFAAHPMSPAKQAEKMREAIAQNYRPAIAERINALRASGVAATPSSGGASTVVKSVTSTAQ